jgi:[protein-PII] uridylyltransferase
VAIAQNEFRLAMNDWPQDRLETYIAKLYPAYWLKVDLPHKIEHANFVRATEEADKRLATTTAFDAERAVTELTLLAPDHPWLLSIIAGACAMAGANIVDAQIYTTTDGRALDTI